MKNLFSVRPSGAAAWVSSVAVIYIYTSFPSASSVLASAEYLGNPYRCCSYGTPTERQVSKRKVSERSVSKRLKRQVYKTSGLQNVRFTKCQIYKTSGLQNVRLQKNIHKYSVLVVGGSPQVMLQPCLHAK